MPKRKSLMSNTNMSTTSSSSCAFEGHESLGANHYQAYDAHTPSLDAGSLSVMPIRRGGIHLERHVCTRKYITQWMPDHSRKCVFLYCKIEK
jgi:hypothetical protein